MNTRDYLPPLPGDKLTKGNMVIYVDFVANERVYYRRFTHGIFDFAEQTGLTEFCRGVALAEPTIQRGVSK